MKTPQKNRICIIGAGFAGREIASEINRKGIYGKVVAFLTDDGASVGSEIDGIPVFSPVSVVAEVKHDLGIEEAIIALTDSTRDELARIYSLLKQADFQSIKILPRASQIVDGDAHLIQTRNVDLQDLLRRNPLVIPLRKSLQYLRGRRVLITGAGGSIGGELARQLLSGGAQRLYLFDHGENNVFEIEKELRLLQDQGVGEAASIVPVVGELQDRDYVQFILERLKADVIFHCAAYKHVSMMEANPVEAIKNNVFGTLNLVEAARRIGSTRFVLISTDKAVEPTAVYGASKMLAEEIVLHNNGHRHDFIVVRFGNVLGSRGSIVPIFKDQILSGGPVTITHEEVARFFMTIPESASLVLQAGGVGRGGNLYILEMGEQIRIRDLADQMIRFYGYTPGQEIPIRYIGLREGEKLTEQLWASDESPEKTDHPGILLLNRKPRFNGELSGVVESLRDICFFNGQRPEVYRNRRALRSILSTNIPSLPVPENEPEY